MPEIIFSKKPLHILVTSQIQTRSIPSVNKKLTAQFLCFAEIKDEAKRNLNSLP